MDGSSFVEGVRRRAPAAILIAAVVVLLTLFAWDRTPRTYRATAVVHVPTATPGGTDYFAYDVTYSDRLVNTYRRILASRSVIDEMRQRVEAATGRVMEPGPDVTVDVPANSELVLITVETGDRRLAADGANALAGILVWEITQARQSAPGAPKAGDARVRVIDAARVPAEPSSPAPVLVGAIAAVVGGALGLTLVGLSVRRDDRLWTADDVSTATKMPLLGQLGRATRRPAPRREATLMRTALEVSRNGRARVLVVTAASRSADAIVADLATAVARTNKNVLVVDAALRAPTLHRVFDVSNDAGLTTLLDGSTPPADTVIKSEVPSVSVVPAGPSVTDEPASVLAASEFGSVLDEVARGFDVVLLAAPGVLVSPDASIIGLHADCSILVVELGAVDRAAAEGAGEHVRSITEPVLGVLVRERQRRW